MSRSKDPTVVKILGGNDCPKCNRPMQRYEHGPLWKPQPGRNSFEFWDRCEPCGHLQHYPQAKVVNHEH